MQENLHKNKFNSGMLLWKCSLKVNFKVYLGFVSVKSDQGCFQHGTKAIRFSDEFFTHFFFIFIYISNVYHTHVNMKIIINFQFILCISNR